MEQILEFLNTYWDKIVELFKNIWEFAKNTVLKDDSIFAADSTTLDA